MTVKEGTSFAFGLSAEEINLTYQWQLSTDGGDSWNNIPSANESTCDVLNVTTDMHGYEYRCIVTGKYGVVISESAFLTVTAAVEIPHPISICY